MKVSFFAALMMALNTANAVRMYSMPENNDVEDFAELDCNCEGHSHSHSHAKAEMQAAAAAACDADQLIKVDIPEC